MLSRAASIAMATFGQVKAAFSISDTEGLQSQRYSGRVFEIEPGLRKQASRAKSNPENLRRAPLPLKTGMDVRHGADREVGKARLTPANGPMEIVTPTV